MSGYSEIIWSTKEKEISIRVRATWYEGAIKGSTPTQPYEHPIKADEYKLEYTPRDKYKIKVGRSKEDQDIESGI